MRNPRAAMRVAWALLAAAGIAAASVRAAEYGWAERSLWWSGSLPERKVTYADNAIAVSLRMAPDTGVVYERSGKWPSSSAASIRMSADNVNATGNAYVPTEAFFPVSVTFAFGEDSLELGWKERVSLFFRYLWSGFPPSGIRLTYAWGNRIPTGSMYRLRDEETVFVLAGGEEAGKEVSVVRRLADDFRAAYARAPKGPVTTVVVRAGRPSAEKGAVKAAISLGFPSN